MQQKILAKRIVELKDSVTLQLNEKVSFLNEKGKRVYNLTAGQLPFRPAEGIGFAIQNELNFLKSFQYSPVAGFKELQTKLINYIEKRRGVKFGDLGVDFSCAISNGAKQSIYNLLGVLIDAGDEVLLFSPYWISYPEMVALWGGRCIEVKSDSHHSFVPSLEELKSKISARTKVIILNVPNNPSGVHYPDDWMREFAKIVERYPNLVIISDEIYYDVSYFDPPPTYFYQHNEELLKRTIIIEGVSKSLALTGLRIGYAVGPKPIIEALVKLQGQTTSGASSLIQRALLQFDFAEIDNFLKPIKSHLRKNAQIIKDCFEQNNLSLLWYQPLSAFYFLIDFKKSPIFSSYEKHLTLEERDASVKICEDLLDNWGVAIVPGADFGAPNTGRISLVLEESYFKEAILLIAKFLSRSS